MPAWDYDSQGDLTPPDDPTDPPHYHLAIQPIDYILANDLGFCEGNVVKYVSRWRAKGGINDLEKAKKYIDFLIAAEQKRK